MTTENLDPNASPAPAPTAPSPAPAAPAPAPVTPDALEISAPAPEAAPPFEPTGDARVDVALNFLAGVGIKSTDEAVVAARAGDFALLEAQLKVLGDKAKGYAPYLDLAKSAYKEAETKANAAVQATAAIVQDVAKAAGADWNAVRAWAAKEATPEEREQVNSAFKQGGLTAKLTAEYLVRQFTKANGKQGAPAAKPNAAPTQDTTSQHVSGAEFRQKSAEFIAKANGRDPRRVFPEYAQLEARRLASIRAGVR